MKQFIFLLTALWLVAYSIPVVLLINQKEKTRECLDMAIKATDIAEQFLIQRDSLQSIVDSLTSN